MENTKKWWQSKGILGALFAGAAMLWNLFESIHHFVDANPDLEKGVGTVINALASDPSALAGLGFIFIAWLGRWKATDRISNDLY